MGLTHRLHARPALPRGLVPPPPPPPPRARPPDPEVIPGRVLVRAAPRGRAQRIPDDVRERLQARGVQGLRGVGSTGWVVADIEDGQTPEAKVLELAAAGGRPHQPPAL
jgi:hypothetical protein